MVGRGLTGLSPAHRGRILLAALCAVLTALSGVYFVRSLLKPDTGLVVMYPEVTVEDGRVVFSPRAPFSAAAASGLRARRDQILSIDGVPVRSSWDVLQADARIRGFAPFPVEVLRDGAERLTVSVTPVFTPTRPDWVFVLAFCVVLAITAALLAARSPAEPGTAFLVLASLFYLVFTCVKPFYYESLLANLLVHVGKLTPWLLVFFGLYFPFRRGTRATRAVVICLLMLGYAAFSAARIGVYIRWAEAGGEPWLELYRKLGRAGNAAEGVSYLAWGSLMASAYTRARTAKEKAQLRWILAGILVALPAVLLLRPAPPHPGPSRRAHEPGKPRAALPLVHSRVHADRAHPSPRVQPQVLSVSRDPRGHDGRVGGGALRPPVHPPARGAGCRLRPCAACRGLASAMALFALLVPLRWLLARLADLAVRHPRGTSAAELERKNAELELLVEELGRQEARTLQGRRLSELRTVLRGVVRGLQEPARDVSSALTVLRSRLVETPPAGDRGTAEALVAPALEASARIAEVLRALESLAGPLSRAPAKVEAGTIVRLGGGTRAPETSRLLPWLRTMPVPAR